MAVYVNTSCPDPPSTCLTQPCTAPGFVVPGSIYRMDVGEASPAPSLYRTTELKVPHSADDYEVKQVG
jgi:hypothetical protein